MRNKAAHERAMWLNAMAKAFWMTNEGIREAARLKDLHEQNERALLAVRREANRVNADWRGCPRPMPTHDYGDYTPRRMAGDADEGD